MINMPLTSGLESPDAHTLCQPDLAFLTLAFGRQIEPSNHDSKFLRHAPPNAQAGAARHRRLTPQLESNVKTKGKINISGVNNEKLFKQLTKVDTMAILTNEVIPHEPARNDNVSYGKSPMNSGTDVKAGDLLTFTVDVVVAHISNNAVSTSDLPQLVREVYQALAKADLPPQAEVRPSPAVPISKSVTPDHIICLEDGKKLRVLKRYLKRNHGLSIEDYRARWNLPDDYPVVAPNYSQERRELAKQIGLGVKFRRPTRQRKS